jgi:hypothetical protein
LLLFDLQDKRERLTTYSLADCQTQYCRGATLNPDTPIVLAPSVWSGTPKDPVRVGASFDVRVDFVTDMDTSFDAQKTLTVQGCGTEQPSNQIIKPRWDGSSSITARFMAASHGTLTLTVHHDAAMSFGSDIELDGNQTAQVFGKVPEGPVQPNGDDYVWHVPCTGIDGYKAGPVSLNWVQGPLGQHWTETWTFQACPDPTLGKPLWGGDEHDYWVNSDGSHQDRNVGRAA